MGCISSHSVWSCDCLRAAYFTNYTSRGHQHSAFDLLYCPFKQSENSARISRGSKFINYNPYLAIAALFCCFRRGRNLEGCCCLCRLWRSRGCYIPAGLGIIEGFGALLAKMDGASSAQAYIVLSLNRLIGLALAGFSMIAFGKFLRLSSDRQNAE